MFVFPPSDPMPPFNQTIAEAKAGDFTVTEEVIEKLNEWRPVIWTYQGRVKPESEYWFYQRWFRAFRRWAFDWVDTTRWEPLSKLGNHLSKEETYGTQSSGSGPFRYLGDGWFYSSYKMDRGSKAFQWMVEYMEGSLFDWQAL